MVLFGGMMGTFFVNATLHDVMGILGVALYLGSYAALQLGFLRGRSYSYALINTGAAACVLLSLVEDFNLSSALIQVSWIAISVVGMTRLYVLSHRIRFSDDENDFLRDKLPHLARHQARRLLNIGQWWNGAVGTELIREGEMVPYLVYLSSGEASVSMNGQQIAQCRSGTFLGELTCLTGDPATASVTISQDARYLMIEAAALRRLLDVNEDIRLAIDRSFASDTRTKLVISNRALIGTRASMLA